MITVDEMIPVAGILERYAEGTQLKVWFKYACGETAPQYAGLFVVGANALRDLETGRIWGVDQVSSIDRRGPSYIVRVEPVKQGTVETVDCTVPAG